MNWIAATALALLVCGTSYSQAAGEAPQFEVASVKPSPQAAPGRRGRRGCFGGPGTPDPVRYTCTNTSLAILLCYAYDLKGYQLRPPPAAYPDEFHLEAKVAPGATAEQVKAMLRSLLAERFKLAFHYEKTERPGYALVVAKGGLKMKESAAEPPPGVADSAPTPAGPVKDADGFSYFARRNAMVVGWANGLTRWVGNNVPILYLTGLGNTLTGKPVVDGTGLTGKYDFMLTFRSDSVEGAGQTSVDDAGGLSFFGAFEKHLGLKLEARKIVIDEFVVDRAERVPVEN